jgi:hypothetical protein
MLAHDLVVWTQALMLDGELAKSEPKRLRYRLMQVAAKARVLRAARQATPSPSLAMDRSAQGRVREAQDAPRHDRLTTSRPATPPEQTARTPAMITPAKKHPHTPQHPRANVAASDRRVHRHHRAPQHTATAKRTHLRALTARSELEGSRIGARDP